MAASVFKSEGLAERLQSREREDRPVKRERSPTPEPMPTLATAPPPHKEQPPIHTTAPIPAVASGSQPPWAPSTDQQKADFLYHTLAAMDPYRQTPADFIHIMVKAAVQNHEIAMDIKRLQEKWRADPQYNAIVAAQRPPVAKYLPPGTVRPAYGPAPPRPIGITSTVCTVAPEVYPIGRIPQAQPVSLAPWVVSSNGTVQRDSVASHLTASQQPPVHQMSSLATKAEQQYTSPSSPSSDDSSIGLDFEEQRFDGEEPTLDLTWILDRAAAGLDWNMNSRYDVYAGIETRLKIERLLKRCDAYMAKCATFANRVHVLTTMREVMVQVLTTQNASFVDSRRNTQYDRTFLLALGRMSREQARDLKVHEGGRWLERFGEVVELANQHGLFKGLQDALVRIDCED